MDLTALNNEFGGEGIRFVSGPGNLAVAEMTNEHGHAEIALHGAHVMSFAPVGAAPVLWMSRQSWFAPGKPIRGGIPVCWPWFGAHPNDPALPGHGFARISEWQVVAAGTTRTGGSFLELRLTEEDVPEAYRGGQPFELLLRVEAAATLRVALRIKNTGMDKLEFSAALHSYFSVGEIGNIKIAGFEGKCYLDTLDNSRGVQQGTLTFDAETDLIFTDCGSVCHIEDPDLERRISVARSGSRCAVVWNPWIEKSRRMPDFGDDEYHSMVCVEAANALDDARSLAPGGVHLLETVIGIA